MEREMWTVTATIWGVYVKEAIGLYVLRLCLPARTMEVPFGVVDCAL